MWRAGVVALPGGFEAGRDPGVTAEQIAEGVELAEAPFAGGGQVGLDQREVGEALQGPPAASGAALLDLGGPDRKIGDLSWVRGSGPGPGAVVGPGQGRYGVTRPSM